MSVPRAQPAASAMAVLRAETARQAAEIHQAVCRYRRQGLRCGTCSETVERAARLALAAAPGCQSCGYPHGVSVPCGGGR